MKMYEFSVNRYGYVQYIRMYDDMSMTLGTMPMEQMNKLVNDADRISEDVPEAIAEFATHKITKNGNTYFVKILGVEKDVSK